MFGYIGDTFWAQANNSVTPQETFSVAANMSAEFGYQNLRLVNSIDVEPGHNIQASNVSTIHAYVQQLRTYSAYVYGRIQGPQFPNQTAMYNEAYLFYKEIGVNGIFIDLAPILYQQIGQTMFNKIMQNLTDSFPGISFMMNYASKSLPVETPLSGTTWGLNTYIMPTVPSGQYTYDSVNQSKIVELNHVFPGHVLLHYDANAGLGMGEPMAVFADASTSNEISALTTLVQNGLNPPSCPSSDKTQCKYDFLVPVLGAWTANNSQYGGTLYNGLSTGKYARSTLNSFVGVIQSNYVLSPSLGPEEFSPSVSPAFNAQILAALTIGPTLLCLFACLLWSFSRNNRFVPLISFRDLD